MSEEVEDSAEETKALPSSQFSEVFACVPLSKPVEKILIRYDKMPDDFCSVLGFFPSRAESPTPGMRGKSDQSHRSHHSIDQSQVTRASRGTRSGTPPPPSSHSPGLCGSLSILTIFFHDVLCFRYVSHQRWIWSVQSCPNVSFSTAALSRILNTLTKLR